jgi:hypothetical protein
MDSYSNKINIIKNTIDEIREDIEKIKRVSFIKSSLIIIYYI